MLRVTQNSRIEYPRLFDLAGVNGLRDIFYSSNFAYSKKMSCTRSARKVISRLVIKKSKKEADLFSPIFIVRKVFLPILRSDMLVSLLQC